MCRFVEEIGGRREICSLQKNNHFFDARLHRFPTVRYVKKAEKAKNVFAIDFPQCYFHSKPPWPIFYNIPVSYNIYRYIRMGVHGHVLDKRREGNRIYKKVNT